MEVVSSNTLLPGDPRLIDHIVCELKSQGIFDQFRKECIADVDTKPAYQNLRQRVEGSVTGFLRSQVWKPDMNKNYLREMLRKNIYESGFLETGVERIVDQVVNPKINTVFLPQVEDVVYKFLGLEKPSNRSNTLKNGPLSIDTMDLLPTDLDPISPDSEVLDKSANKSNEVLDDSKGDDFESPPFEPINEQSVFSQQDESSNDSHLSGISGLTSHDSNLSASPSKTYYGVPEISNQDSQLSKVSSTSRLSIMTTEDKLCPEKMDISDDSDMKPFDNFNFKDAIKSSDKEIVPDKDTTEVEMDVCDNSSQDKTVVECPKAEESKHKSASRHSDSKKKPDRNRSSSSTKDKYRKPARDKEKESSNKSSDKDSSSKTQKSTSSSSKHSSRDKEKPKSSDRKKDSSRSKSSSSKSDKVKSDSSKSKPVKEKSKPEESKSSKTKHSSSSKDRKSSSSHKEPRKDTSKKSSRRDKVDDHSSSKEKKTEPRRSTDRDSNDGNSGVGATNSSKDSTSGGSNKTKSEKSFSGSNSGDSGQSDKPESNDVEPAGLTAADPENQIKLKKPKFASNIFEARRLMKIRKKLEKLERKRQIEFDLTRGTEMKETQDGSEEPEPITIEENVDGGKDDGANCENGEVVSNIVCNDAKGLAKRDEAAVENSVVSVISKESWDAIEAKLNQSSLLNINYDSYIDEGADSCSSNKSAEAQTTTEPEQAERKSSDEEDCLYFNPEISPTTERYLKSIDALQKEVAELAALEEMISGSGNAMAPPDIAAGCRRSRKPNLKYCSTEYESEVSFAAQKVPVVETSLGRIDLTRNRKAAKRRFDGEIDETIDTDNNNKKMHTSLEAVVELYDGETEENDEPSPCASTTSSGSLESFVKSKPSVKPKKIKKTELADSFTMPLSPESDVSANSVEVNHAKRKYNDERDQLVQQLTQPIRHTRGHSQANQRYSSDDLYKPRPLFTGSRRTRGVLNNTDKNTDETPTRLRR